MRASRLINILTTLQARGLVTATELAEENEVAVRTIYRDIDALAASGVPVYAERGPEGGYRLLDGYKVRLNGVSAEEASAVSCRSAGACGRSRARHADCERRAQADGRAARRLPRQCGLHAPAASTSMRRAGMPKASSRCICAASWMR